MKKKIMLLIATMIMVLPVALGLGSTLKAEAAGTVDITLHKKRFTSSQTEIQNTGEIMSEFASADGFGGVEFKIYDVTEEFYALLDTVKPGGGTAKYTMAEASVELSGRSSYTGPLVNTGTTATTGSIGDLTFSGLPDKTNGKNSVYAIVETPMAGVTAAANMIVALPLEDSDGDPLTTIHLYPKNVVETAGVEVEKISSLKDENGDPIPLKDVEFVIHKGGLYSATGTEYLSGFDAAGTPTWTTTKAGAHKFTTGTTGKFKEERLLHGTYYLTEVTPLPGYAIQNGAVNQQFTLDASTPLKSFTGSDAIVNDDIDVKKNHDGETVNVGDFITYSVTSVIPLGINDQIDSDGNGTLDAPRYTKYEVSDTYGTHLSFDPLTAALALTDGTTTFALTTDYTLDTTTAGKFVVKFTADGIAKMTPGATLTMTYKLKLLQTAAPGVDIENTAKIDTNFDTDEGKITVYTGGYNFIKIDGSNDDKALEGAEFVVRDGSDKTTAKYLVIGSAGEVTWSTNAADATPFTSNASGYVTIKGLKDGTYYLQETKTPTDKYVLLEDMVAFTVSKTSFDTTDPLTTGDPSKVVNKQKGSLPSTGGSGIYVMMALGVAVMAVVGVWYVRSQRKEA